MKTAFHKTDSSLLDSRPSAPFFKKPGEETFIPNSQDTQQQFTDPSFIQPKLTIGEPNDKYEKEADSMADKVMSMDSSKDNGSAQGALQKKGADGLEEDAVQAKFNIQKQEAPAEEDAVQAKFNIQKQEAPAEEDAVQAKFNIQKQEAPAEEDALQAKFNIQKQEAPAEEDAVQAKFNIQKQEAPAEEDAVQAKFNIQKQEAPAEEDAVQAKFDVQRQEETEDVSLQAKHQNAATEGGGSSSDLSSQLGQKKGKGDRLPEDTNSFMSSAFGTDFSDVNIHTGQDAVQMNQDLGARAFTNGSDIYFNKGEFQPDSSKGKKLLAHELTHVVQQNQKNFSSIQRTGDKGNKLLNDFAKDFKDAAELIKKSPEAMKLVKEALKDGVKYGGHAETGPGKMAWPYTIPSTKTVYVPKARTDKVIAMSDFIFELNNAIHGKKLAGIQEEGKKGSKGSLTAKQYAYKILSIEVDGMLRTGKVGADLQKALKEGKVWFKKYDADFFLSVYKDYKDGKKTKDQIVKSLLKSPSGADPSKTHEKYYMDQYTKISGGK